jgi:magnesium-transporting ATPase (P-type)
VHIVKVGNRTECALLALTEALGADYEAIRENTQTLRVFPFTSDTKRMTSVTRYPSGE